MELVILTPPEGTIPVRMTTVAGGKALRSPIIEGMARVMPKIGKQFVMTGAPLEEGGGMRLVNTSPIVAILDHDGDGVLFETESGSRYLVEGIDDE